jgi:hypothetical protein
VADLIANTEPANAGNVPHRIQTQKSALERRKTDVIGLDKCWEGIGLVQLMKWFRSTIRSSAQLALFALAVQMIVSFGHIHSDDLGLAPFATTHRAHFPSDAAQTLTGPADRDEYPASDDYCPICASIALLATGAPSLPTVVVAPPPVSRAWSLLTSLYLPAMKATFSFQARGPPAA